MNEKVIFKVLGTKIDDVDKRIMNLLLERFSIVDEMSKIQKSIGMPALDEKKFKEIIERLKEIGKNGNLSDNFIEDIWHRIYLEVLMRQK